jgi:hypothetical protein
LFSDDPLGILLGKKLENGDATTRRARLLRHGRQHFVEFQHASRVTARIDGTRACLRVA